MSGVVDHLAELTGFRDRDVMDVTLVTALRDLLNGPVAAVAIYRCVGEPGQQRWLTRARLRSGDSVATADSLWVDPDSLPRLAEHPRRLECLTQRSVLQQREGEEWVTLFPLATEREVVGVLELHTARRLKAEAQRMVSSVLRIYHNFQGLLDYSERDTLTGLLNRKTFDESFLKAVSELPMRALSDAAALDEAGQDRRHAAVHPRYWLGVIDIDLFKTINDRFGGEEFVVLMRCEDEPDAAHAFERFRNNTAQYAFPQVGRITVSIGFTQIRGGDSPAAAFERADKAVYHAKGAGRNQVQSHATLVAQGAMSEAKHLSDVELF